MRLLNDQDMEVYNERIAGAALGVDLGGSFASSVAEGFQGNVTDTIIDFTKNMIYGSDDGPKLTGKEVNEMYGLDEDLSFDADEEVDSYRAEAIGERHKQKLANNLEMNYASEVDSLAGVTNFVGGLVGGMADPVGIVAGNVVGGLVISSMAKYAPAVAKIAKASTIGQKMALEATENVIGAVFIDSGALYANKKLHMEEVEFDEFVGLVAGSAIAGAGFGAVKGLVSNFRTRMGDNAQGLLNDMLKQEAYANFKGANVSTDHIVNMKSIELYDVRDGQTAYNYTPVTSTADVKSKTFFASRIRNEGKMYQDSRMGGGAYFFSDNSNLMNNAVHSLDNKKSGKVMEISINENTKIAGPDEVDTIKGFLKEKYDIDIPKDFNDAHEIITHLDDVLPENVDSRYVFNKSIIDAGYDGYSAKGYSLKGEESHNGLVMLDKRSFGIETKNKFSHLNKEGMRFDSDLLTKVNEIDTMPVNKDSIQSKEITTKMQAEQKAIVEQLDTSKPTEPELDFDIEESKAISASDSVSTNKQYDDFKAVLSGMEDVKYREKVMAQLSVLDSDESMAKIAQAFETCRIGV